MKSSASEESVRRPLRRTLGSFALKLRRLMGGFRLSSPAANWLRSSRNQLRRDAPGRRRRGGIGFVRATGLERFSSQGVACQSVQAVCWIGFDRAETPVRGRADPGRPAGGIGFVWALFAGDRPGVRRQPQPEGLGSFAPDSRLGTVTELSTSAGRPQRKRSPPIHLYTTRRPDSSRSRAHALRSASSLQAECVLRSISSPPNRSWTPHGPLPQFNSRARSGARTPTSPASGG